MLGKEILAACITMQNAILAAFLIVHDDLQCDRRFTRPLRVWRGSSVADHVARIIRAIRMEWVAHADCFSTFQKNGIGLLMTPFSSRR